MLRLALTILWPSFLTAIVAEGVFFSAVDPLDLRLTFVSAELPPIALYTIGFFFFWIFCAAASALTHYLLKLPERP